MLVRTHSANTNSISLADNMKLPLPIFSLMMLLAFF